MTQVGRQPPSRSELGKRRASFGWRFYFPIDWGAGTLNDAPRPRAKVHYPAALSVRERFTSGFFAKKRQLGIPTGLANYLIKAQKTKGLKCKPLDLRRRTTAARRLNLSASRDRSYGQWLLTRIACQD